MPHIHVRYQGSETVFDLEGRLVDGEVGNRAARLVTEWCQERAHELQQAWSAAVAGEEIPWVRPLQ